MIPSAIRIVVAIATIAAFATATHLTPALQLALWDGSHGPVNHFGAETWIAAGAAHSPAGWLGDAFLARVGPTIGLRGLDLLAALTVTLALAMTEHRARSRGGALLASIAVLLAFSCAIGVFDVGDGFATDAFFSALVLALLDRGGRSRFGIVVAIFAWAWLSPHALLGVMFVVATAGGFVLQARIEGDEKAQSAKELLGIALGSLIATMATPALVTYEWASLEALHIDGQNSPYTVHPGDVLPLAYHGGFTALLFIAVIVGAGYGPAAFAAFRASRPAPDDLPASPGAAGPADAAVLGTAIVLAFFDGHLLPIAGIAAAPVLAGATARRFGIPHVSRVVPLAVAAAGVMSLLAVVVLDGRHGRTRFDPTHLVDVIAADPAAHTLYCSTPLWCDGALGSHVRVGVDSRTGWPDSAIADQTAVATLGPHWSRILDRAGVDRIVAYRTTALAGLLRLRHDWRVIGDDGIETAFARVGEIPKERTK